MDEFVAENKVSCKVVSNVIYKISNTIRNVNIHVPENKKGYYILLKQLREAFEENNFI